MGLITIFDRESHPEADGNANIGWLMAKFATDGLLAAVEAVGSLLQCALPVEWPLLRERTTER
jgi:hypothetical protein